MKKIITILLAVLLILAMAIPSMAVTPPLDTPAIPRVPDISDDIHVEIPDEVFDDWFAEHPIVIEPTEAPTEPAEEDEPTRTDWSDWLSGWRQWWKRCLLKITVRLSNKNTETEKSC